MNVIAALAHLSDALPGWEARPGQVEMASAVAHAIAGNRDLLVEAGTGTGKTLAYLIPALGCGKRVLVSTATRHLQTQLLDHDLPAALAATGQARTVAVLKGRNNYLCHHRIEVALRSRVMLGQPPLPELLAIERATRSSETGDKAEVLGIDEGHAIWPEVTSTADNCLGSQCSRAEECFVLKARRQAAAADVVIVNHHLLLADFSVRERWQGGGLLPTSGVVIIDEAHALADAVTTFFGAAVTERRLTTLVRDVRLSRKGVADPLLSSGLAEASDALEERGAHLWQAARLLGHSAAVHDKTLDQLRPLALEVDDALAWLQSLCAAEEASRDPTLAKTTESLFAVRADLDACIPQSQPDAAMVRWVELRARDAAVVARPVDVGPILARTLLAETGVRIFTSATLAIAGRFELVRERLGLHPDTEGLTVASPFDFQRQALLYVPRRMPEPFAAGRNDAVSQEVAQLALAAGGGTLALFSSHRALQEAADAVRQRLPFAVLVQGQEPRERLLERFAREQPCALLATMGFWHGVDLPAHALRVVILDKIPFPPPDDPLFKARSDRLQAQGRSSFDEVSIPEAAQSLRQGFGRLIRSQRHAGVVAVLDPRLYSRSYGRRLIAALPPVSRVEEFSDVLVFLREMSDLARG